MAFVSTFIPSALRTSFLSSTSVSRTANVCSISMTASSSPSVPFLPNPKNLSPDMPGYAGFDPLGFSNYINVKFLQEAEIKHCRICMLAVLGMIVAEFYTFPFYSGAPTLARDVHDWGVTQGSMNQLLFWTSFWEVIIGVPAVVQMVTMDSPRMPGEYAFDPLGMAKNPASMKKYQVNEIKNGRLAMIAIGGFIHQEFITGLTPIQQLLDAKFLP